MGAQMAAILHKQFRSDGVVCIRSALNRDSMTMAEDSYNWSLAHPGPYASQFQGTPDSPDKFYQDLLNGKVLTGYRRLLEASNAADIVADLWDSPDVWFFYEQVFLKEGGESRRTPWHQDASYLPIDGEQLAVMWITLIPSSRRIAWNSSAVRIAESFTTVHASNPVTIPLRSMAHCRVCQTSKRRATVSTSSRGTSILAMC